MTDHAKYAAAARPPTISVDRKKNFRMGLLSIR